MYLGWSCMSCRQPLSRRTAAAIRRPRVPNTFTAEDAEELFVCSRATICPPSIRVGRPTSLFAVEQARYARLFLRVLGALGGSKNSLRNGCHLSRAKRFEERARSIEVELRIARLDA